METLRGFQSLTPLTLTILDLWQALLLEQINDSITTHPKKELFWVGSLIFDSSGSLLCPAYLLQDLLTLL